MKQQLIALTDYKNNFGSKHFDSPYRSGMNKNKLAAYFQDYGYEIKFKNFSDINFISGKHEGSTYIYTSSEDTGYHYKSYIEDIVFGLSVHHARMIPDFKYLKANNNKVFMEILKPMGDCVNISNLKAWHFGTFEELQNKSGLLPYPCVLKQSEGASGSGVFLANSRKDLLRIARRISRTKYIYNELWDLARSFKHPNYTRNSRHRRKFIIQELIPGLKNDWKIYFFGERVYLFYRPILKGRGIKASGGGYDNYQYGKEAKLPIELLSFSREFFMKLNVPHLSIDIAYDETQMFILEYQALYFGTAGIPYSDGYFKHHDQNWEFIEEKLEIEKVYTDSIVWYLRKP